MPVLAAFLVLALPAVADRRDQRAADLYVEGVKLIRQGKYREGAARVNAALARGATEPVEEQGSETRFLARPYDPYYWLGVAQMETGLREQALVNLEKSATLVPKGRSRPVLADAPEEWADLARRRAILLAELEPPPAPTAVIAAAPDPTATPFALRLPERTPQIPAVVASAATPPAPVPSRVPPPAPAIPATAFALRDDLSALLADPVVAVRSGEPLRKLLGRLDASCRQGAAAAAAGERAIRRELESSSAAPVLASALAAGLEAQRDRRWADAARLARISGRLFPSAPQPQLLRCAAVGTEWILGGETRAELAAEAREAFGAWLALRPAGAPRSRFLSPALMERLGQPEPVPSRL